MIAGASILIKLGGNAIAGAELAVVARDLAALHRGGAQLVVVHGGGPQTSALQTQLGQIPRQIAGRRVTDEAALDVLKMVVGGKLNIDACAALVHAGARPIGLHGASSLVIEAQRRPPAILRGGPAEPVDLGLVGDVVGVDVSLLRLLMHANHIPVLACIGASSDGQCFNINADVVANRVAVALNVDALVLVSDIPGVLRDVNNPASRIARMTEAEANAAIDGGLITKGMLPKLEEAFAAIRAGVGRVHIVGSLTEGALARELESPGSVGTALLP
ncbi:MAG: acetylglutamate kinase [Myxococcales bacterium]|nr:acetylglutamate kinase [Myxococcales bacterium]